MINTKVKVLISASGSGGHIFPALFVAKALKDKVHENIEINFFGSGRALDKKLIEGAGYKLHSVSVSGITGHGIRGILKFILNLPRAFLKTGKIIRSFKPDIIIGFGGYSTFYPITVGTILGIPTWIHEAEASPGLANKVLAIYATKISVAFKNTSFSKKKSVFTGHPIRPELKVVTQPTLVNPGPSNILVLGGSQGARAIDEGMITLATFLKEKGVTILHQTRPENKAKVENAYLNAKVNATVTSFIDDMVQAYNFSHIIITRSGAGSVAEISAVNRPAIFVPLPTSQGGHQLINAKTLADIGKGIIVTEGENFTERLKSSLTKLLDPDEYQKFLSLKGTDNTREISLNAAHSIADGCLALI